MRLIIATQNQGKLKEIQFLLKGIKIPIISLNQLDKKFVIRENGRTFSQNAFKKTLAVSRFYKDDLVVGEDSGLEVTCLCGAPGVYSKRYAGKNATDEKNNHKLLSALEGIKQKKRKACFRCVIALTQKGKLLQEFDGCLQGYISQEMCGKNGFGYDPLFYLPQYKKTTAQLSLRQKNKISHRALAFNKLKVYFLRSFFRKSPLPSQ